MMSLTAIDSQEESKTVEKRSGFKPLIFLSILFWAFFLIVTSACNSSVNGVTSTPSATKSMNSPPIIKASPSSRPSPYVILPSQIPVSSPFGTPLPAYSVPVIISPPNNGLILYSQAQFSWTPVLAATEYEIIIATDNSLSKPVFGTPTRLVKWVFYVEGIEDNRTYYWTVRVTKPYITAPAAGSFETKFPIIHIPEDGSWDCMLLGPSWNYVSPDLVTFKWEPSSFAYEPAEGETVWEFVIATDSALTKTIAGTPIYTNAKSCQVVNLDYSTSYYWGVRVIKPVKGSQTEGFFTISPPPTNQP
jgi:hypothetical protein